MTTAPRRRYDGPDLHRPRSVVATVNDEGELLGCGRVDKGPLELVRAVTTGDGETEVALEWTSGFY